MGFGPMSDYLFHILGKVNYFAIGIHYLVVFFVPRLSFYDKEIMSIIFIDFMDFGLKKIFDIFHGLFFFRQQS